MGQVINFREEMVKRYKREIRQLKLLMEVGAPDPVCEKQLDYAKRYLLAGRRLPSEKRGWI